MDGEVCNLSRANLRGNDGCMGDYENNEGRLSFSKTVGGSEKYKECGTPLISWPFDRLSTTVMECPALPYARLEQFI